MFTRLGQFIARHWILVILGWVVLLVGLKIVAPKWDQVTLDGDLEHLPAEVGSIQGARLLEEAFPDDRAKSQVVLVVAREEGGLSREDMVLAKKLADAMRDLPMPEGQEVVEVLTSGMPVVGELLKSDDKHARLVVLQMSGEFMATANIETLDRVVRRRDEIIVAYQRELAEEHGSEAAEAWRQGLQVGITGSAAIGGDMLSSAKESIENTETATLVLVVLILLFVYRAPLLVLIPLTSIAVSVVVAMSLVASATQIGQLPGFEWWDFKVFKTTKIFIVVILYGAGTDYCLFLISRYKEELGRGLSRAEATARALGQVGDALAASALTTILGLSMMFFADFGKYSSSGPAIALCLCVALAACVTLAPALLRAFGRIVFWPFGHQLAASGAEASSSQAPRETPNGLLGAGFWDRVSGAVLARPGLILMVALFLMSPLAVYGLSGTTITYDFLAELDADRVSVEGSKLLRNHFPPGETGPITVIAHQEGTQFDSNEGKVQLTELVEDLYKIDGVVSVRSLTTIDGKRPGSRGFATGGFLSRARAATAEAKKTFVSSAPGYEGDVTRLRITLNDDPFSAKAINRLDAIIERLDALAKNPDSAWRNTQFLWVGTTAGIRDLRAVTESDRTLIQQLVVLAVLMVLLLILRRPVICVYLILSVLFSYFVTIGITQLVFQWLYAGTFHGLDWKVPLFLFVILIAVGEDYNIYLATRVFEEQEQLGPRRGLRFAIVQTGGIITSCGVIMAGTFVSMMFGSLRGMTELGFALSLGVLLDTFIIRTVLVPAFFALIIPRDAKEEPSTSSVPAISSSSNGSAQRENIHTAAGKIL